MRAFGKPFLCGLDERHVTGPRRRLSELRYEKGPGPHRIALFGASTGAAAALWAAADPSADISSVVSRGGRPDLALPHLSAVVAPTLLIVGGRDLEVLGLNRAALTHLGGEAHLEVVPGATHLFEEPGSLQAAAHLAADWFLGHLRPSDGASGRGRERPGRSRR